MHLHLHLCLIALSLLKLDQRELIQQAGGNPNRNEAKEKAESRRKKFFERKRSRKEAERSEVEQEATQGKFITTLGR